MINRKHRIPTTILSALSACLLLATPLPAQEESGDDETEAQQEEVQDPAEEGPGGRNINAFTRNLMSKTVVGGYFDTEYFFPQDKNSFFDNHRLILQVSSQLHERLFFNTEIEYEHGGVLGGGTNDGELKIEQAWLDFLIERWLVVRAGVVLIPVGRLNVLHDSDFRDTTARPLFSTVIVPSTWMEPGIGVHGTVSPSDDWELSYEVYITQGLTDQLADGNGLRKARPSLSKDNNAAKAVTSRVGFSPFLGLEFGLSGYFSPYDEASAKKLGLMAADFHYTLGPFEFLGEGGLAFFDPSDLKDKDGNVTGQLGGPMGGYYLEGHYHFFPDFLKETFLGQGLDQAVFTAFARLDQVDTNWQELNAHDRTQLTLGLNYRPIPSTAFKLEYQWNIENEAILRGDPTKEKANNQFIASVAVGF